MATAAKKIIPIVPKAKGTAVQPWEQEMANAARKQAAVEKPMGLFKQIVVKAATLFIDDKPIPGNKMNIIVLAATHENQWFNKPYNPAVPAVPACYAFGDRSLEDPEAELAPASNVDERQGFSADEGQGGEGAKCSNCWANVMGTADTGKGKACQNVRRLICTTEDALESADKMKDAEMRSLKVPVMSVKNWVNFVHEIEETVKRPYWGVIAELSVVPDAKSQWQVKFAFQELITFDQALYDMTQKRIKQAEKEIMAPYPKLEEQPEPARGRAAAARRETPVKTGGKPQGQPARKAGKY